MGGVTDRGVLTELQCTGCDWMLPPGWNPDHGTAERPGCADYVDEVMPLIGAHIDETGHSVCVIITTRWADRDEVSSVLVKPRPVVARDVA